MRESAVFAGCKIRIIHVTASLHDPRHALQVELEERSQSGKPTTLRQFLLSSYNDDNTAISRDFIEFQGHTQIQIKVTCFWCFLRAWCSGYPRTVLSLEQGLTIVLFDVFARWQHHQNLMTSKLGHVYPSMKISAKSACNFLCNPANRQINKRRASHNLYGGGKKDAVQIQAVVCERENIPCHKCTCIDCRAQTELALSALKYLK